MKIRVYDVKYGESILIMENSKRALLVDCGSDGIDSRDDKCKFKKDHKKTNELFDRIYTNLSELRKKKKLCIDGFISHFHKDHISGFVYFAKEKKKIILDTLYLPDIFCDEHLHSVVLTILDVLLAGIEIEKIKGGKASLSLLEFVNGLVKTSRNVRFLQKGASFHSFSVLAPDLDVVEKQATGLLGRIESLSNDGPSIELLQSIAKLLIKILQEKSQQRKDNQHEYDSNWEGQLQERLNENNTDEKLQSIIDRLTPDDRIQISSFAHKINIIFHSKDDIPRWNVLFTGDADPKVLKDLENIENDDKVLYSKYAIYKIPHHGTENHFYALDRDRTLVCNGIISNGHTFRQHTKISEKYCKPAGNCPTLYCTNCNHCQGFFSHTGGNGSNGYCKNMGNHLVYGCKYIDIVLK